jgi:glycosyltransferase involved in cell wall biosynthesis
MNIAFIGNYLPDMVSGVAVSGFTLAKSLVQLGHNVFFYYGDTQASRTKDDNGIFRQAFLKKNLYSLPIGMYDFLKSNPDHIDIFHIHSVFYLPNTLITNVLQRLKYKYVCSPHGGYNENIFNRGKLKKAVYFHLFEKKMIKGASAVFCLAEREIVDLKRFDYKGLIKIIPNAIDVHKLQKQVVTRDKNTKNAFHIIYLGRYDMYHKGLDRLCRIFAYINQLNKNIYLNLYGKGKDKAKLQSLIHELKLENISLNQPIYGAEKATLLQQADLYIQTSRWEAFGISIFEAAILGIPVALSKGCYLSDFFEKNNLGIILDENEEYAAKQIVEAIDNEDFFTKIHEGQGRLIIEKFAPKVIAQLAVQAYQETLQYDQ